MANFQISINDEFWQLIPYGYCACGCGGKTKISLVSHKTRRLFKGRHFKFIHNHHGISKNNGNWHGGISFKAYSHGKRSIRMPDHPRATKTGYIAEYILVAEKALGKYLPSTAPVHHHTEKQLVICQNNAYHKLLHQRQRAFEASGHANWLKCPYCKEYDDPVNLFVPNIPRRSAYHRSCKAKWMKKQKLNSHFRLGLDIPSL